MVIGLTVSACRSGQVGAVDGGAGRPSSSPAATWAASTGSGIAVTASKPPPAPGYTFPIRAKTVSYGRVHHDYPAADIFAACGSAVVAPVTGRIVGVSRTDVWSPDRNDGATRGGLSVTILGVDGVRYYGSHLRSLAASTVVGAEVVAGTRLGEVGHTGDARSVACHLHFGISPACTQPGDWWNRRGMLSPYPYLQSWQAHHDLSPRAAASKLRKTHRCLDAPGVIDP